MQFCALDIDLQHVDGPVTTVSSVPTSYGDLLGGFLGIKGRLLEFAAGWRRNDLLKLARAVSIRQRDIK